MSNVLLHGCCAHCSAYAIDHWRALGHQVTLLWYNPNIHPYTEHQHRLEAVQQIAQAKDLAVIIAPGYDFHRFFRDVAGHETERCRYCFALRLGYTASVARERGFDSFTSTLAISPHQKHDLIRIAGEEASLKYGVEFCYADLRKHYSDSRRQTKPMGLYRQQYCGCIYSEWERVQQESAGKTSAAASPAKPD